MDTMRVAKAATRWGGNPTTRGRNATVTPQLSRNWPSSIAYLSREALTETKWPIQFRAGPSSEQYSSALRPRV